MSTITSISQRTLRSFQYRASVYRRRYDPLLIEDSLWHLDGKCIPALVVPVYHPVILAGDEHHLDGQMDAAEIY